MSQSHSGIACNVDLPWHREMHLLLTNEEDPTAAIPLLRSLSCIPIRPSPVVSSTSIQPTDQMSQGKDQPRPRMTSGAR